MAIGGFASTEPVSSILDDYARSPMLRLSFAGPSMNTGSGLNFVGRSLALTSSVSPTARGASIEFLLRTAPPSTSFRRRDQIDVVRECQPINRLALTIGKFLMRRLGLQASSSFPVGGCPIILVGSCFPVSILPGIIAELRRVPQLLLGDVGSKTAN